MVKRNTEVSESSRNELPCEQMQVDCRKCNLDDKELISIQDMDPLNQAQIQKKV